ncbi:MAG: prolyl oligopeptidase family serine peptidase, partial [Bacteroidales bacterium]|nr:prolyl oligopeptidase family serine peptidase [Bacteroidales bacterium]
MRTIALMLFLFYIYSSTATGQSLITEGVLSVLGNPSDAMMRDYFRELTDRQFTLRDSLLNSLRSAEEWDMRAQTIRDSMISWTGPLPERTPLNARTTGKLQRDGYTIEKVLFESRPGFYVSGNLYLPDNFSGKRPAHLNVIGHAKVGKADERYQRMSISQAKKGFVVLTIDQLGQGERQVPLYEQWGSAPGNAHRITGTQAFLSGTHVFNIMVWDAIRAVDFLAGRPEVDPEKICMTGSSGGGMMTTYILPFDDRIAVAVPACNPNTWSYRVHANLATDHEQVFFAAFESGIDPRGDPLFCQVPRPLMLNTTSDDNLNPPRGVWELDTWLSKSYSVHGVPEKVTTSMVRAAHDYNREQREATYSWMLKWTG